MQNEYDMNYPIFGVWKEENILDDPIKRKEFFGALQEYLKNEIEDDMFFDILLKASE